MAEGFARHLKSEIIDAYSAGTNPRGLDPKAVAVMKEVGVDISSQKSKHVNDLKAVKFDYVITVCGDDETCPFFPGPTKALHLGFDDPPKLAATAQTEAEALAYYRRVRDEIKAFVAKLPGILKKLEGARP
jgi:arsenate reductase